MHGVCHWPVCRRHDHGTGKCLEYTAACTRSTWTDVQISTFPHQIERQTEIKEAPQNTSTGELPENLSVDVGNTSSLAEHHIRAVRISPGGVVHRHIVRYTGKNLHMGGTGRIQPHYNCRSVMHTVTPITVAVRHPSLWSIIW